MNRSRIGRVVPVTIVVVLVVIASSVVAVSAQGNNPLGEILAKLDEIIEMLTAPPVDAEVTLASSAVLVPTTQTIGCLLVNVGTENVDGAFRVIGSLGDVIAERPVLVEPGRTGGIFDDRGDSTMRGHV